MEMYKKLQWYLCIILILENRVNTFKSRATIKHNSQLLKNDDETIEGECLIISEKIANIPSLFQEIGGSVSLECQVHLQTAVLNFKKIFDDFIVLNSEPYLKTIHNIQETLIKIQKQKSNELNYPLLLTESIKTNDFCNARIHFLEINQTIHLKEIVENIYNKNILNAEILFNFFNSFDNVEEKLFGYRLLLDEMKKYEHQYNVITTIIGFQVMNNFLSFRNSDNYILFMANLPNSIKLFPFYSNFLLRNVKYSTCLIATGHLFNSDNNKRHIFTHKNCKSSADSRFSLIPNINWTYFHIKNNNFNEFLIGDENQFSYDGERRRIVSIKYMDPNDKKGQWHFESIKGTEYFKIKNLHWNEDLFTDDYFQFEYSVNHSYVFTWKSGVCGVDKCKWKIERF